MNRYALTIGINQYPGAPLAGCVNDAVDVGDTLLRMHGYAVSSLLDAAASRDAILGAIAEHVARLRYQDRLVIHFSGHGTKVPDANSDEDDGWDEAWVSADMQAITDDDLGSLLAARAYGSRVVVLSDSCFAGTITRIGGFGDVRSATFDPARPVKRKAIPAGMLGASRDLTFAPEPTRHIVDVSRSNVLLFAAAKSSEYAYDAWFDVGGTWRPNGAFTFSLLRALVFEAPDDYRRWHDALGLPTGEYPQTPQLEGTYRQTRWAPLD